MKRINRRLGLKGVFNDKGIDGFDFYKSHPTDSQVFQSLGFRSLTSLDSNAYEGASIIHDLNEPIQQQDLQDRFDVIFDGGTTEHISDQLQVLENLFRLCKVGGLIIHYTPANNFLDHGYVQPSPSFYREYYKTNDFKILQAYLVESKASWGSRRAVLKYDSLAYEFVSYGGHWSKRMLGNWFVVQKQANSSYRKIPQQLRSTVNYENATRINNYTGVLLKIQEFLHSHPKLRYGIVRLPHRMRRLGWLARNKVKRRPKAIFYV